MSSIRQKARVFRLKILAKLLRSLILTIARITYRDKPTPDLIEYISATSTSTKKANSTSTEPLKHRIKLHIYHPPTTPRTIAFINNPSPVFITACGSGFITPGLGLDDHYCHLIASKTTHTVIDVGYCVAPENPFPEALKDLVAVVNWVRSQPERFDASRITIGGFSAGANLATSIAVNYFPPRTFWGLVTFYPALDMSTVPGQKIAFPDMEAKNVVDENAKDIPEITTETEIKTKSSKPPLGGMASVPTSAMKFMRDCYLANSWDGTANADILKDPRVSPAFADLGRFPTRCLFITAEYDCLAPEAEVLAGRIKGGEVNGEERKVVVYRAMGCGHMFDKNVESGSAREERKDEAYGLVVDMLKGD